MPNTEVTILDSRHEALAVLRELKRRGVPDSSITVMSSEPLPLEAKPWSKSRIPGFAIIVFEMTALGAILFTLGRMIYESRLVRRPPGEYDSVISEGKIVIAIENRNHR